MRENKWLVISECNKDQKMYKFIQYFKIVSIFKEFQYKIKINNKNE